MDRQSAQNAGVAFVPPNQLGYPQQGQQPQQVIHHHISAFFRRSATHTRRTDITFFSCPQSMDSQFPSPTSLTATAAAPAHKSRTRCSSASAERSRPRCCATREEQ